MKQRIKKIVLDYYNRPFVRHADNNSIDVRSFYPGYYKSFGHRNPDKIFYVIWLDNGGSGFFSNVSSILCHLKLAREMGMIPVIDLENFKTLYNVASPIDGVGNAWEYYFEPVSEFQLGEVYESKNVFFCNGKYPSGFSYSITKVAGLYEIFREEVRIRKQVKDVVKKYMDSFKMDGDARILGIHFRGQEQKLAPAHSFPPTEKQMLRYADQILEKYNINKILIVTEDQGYLDLFIRQYGDRVLFTNSYRTYGVNAYKLNPRNNHRYHLGLDVLVDALLLSKCTALLCGDSNVSEFARFVNNHQYEVVYKILNGTNSTNPIVARYLFNFKKNFPFVFGGLADHLLVYKYEDGKESLFENKA